jgi:hypothetical protein
MESMMGMHWLGMIALFIVIVVLILLAALRSHSACGLHEA